MDKAVKKPKVAVIINHSLGWRSIRETWARELAGNEEFDFLFLHLEDYLDKLPAFVTSLERFQSLPETLTGREAAKDAIKQGCSKIIIATTHNAGALPEKKGVKYYIYGDASIRQLDSFGYYNSYSAQQPRVKRLLNSLIRAIYKKFYDVAIKRLARNQHIFLCMSKWNEDGLIEDYDGIKENSRILPPSVNSTYWAPSPDKQKSERFSVLFLGGDFQRKGGDLVLEVSKRPEFQNVVFNFVTRSAPAESSSNTRFHLDMKPNSQALLDLLRSSDILVLPTRADCSPVAVLECASVGMPAIVNHIAGVSELVKDGTTGVLLKRNDADEIADAIKLYLDQPDTLREHGLAARKYVSENFDIQITMKKLLAYLRE